MKTLPTEIIGLPGAGKTYYVQQNSGYTINSKLEKLFYAILFVLFNPYRSLIYIFNIFRFHKSLDDQRKNRSLLKKKLLIIFPAAIAIEQKTQLISIFESSKQIIYSDGLLYLALSTFDTSAVMKDIQLYAIKKRYIILEVNNTIRHQRMRNRGRIPRVDLYSPDLYEEFEKNLDNTLRKLKELQRA